MPTLNLGPSPVFASAAQEDQAANALFTGCGHRISIQVNSFSKKFTAFPWCLKPTELAPSVLLPTRKIILSISHMRRIRGGERREQTNKKKTEQQKKTVTDFIWLCVVYSYQLLLWQSICCLLSQTVFSSSTLSLWRSSPHRL